jgi:SAM-dependent methyltransferase
LNVLGVKPTARYEKSIFNSGRSDALHGQVVIEYEPPKSFKSLKSINHAYGQLVRYIQGLSKSEKETLFIFESKFVGVGFDGEKIFFVRYKGSKELPKLELEEKDFALLGPYIFSGQSARTLLTHLRALARLPLSAENLAQKFGPGSDLAPKAVSAFADSLEYWGDQTRIRTFYNEWKRLFGIVYGEQFNDKKDKGVKTLTGLYKVGEETDFQELLFSVHTYFAFLIKLIAAELLTLRETAFHSSFALNLAHASEVELKQKLSDIEDGGVYSRRGITNFLEGDFFRWYLDAWSPRLKAAIQEIANALAEFEPATTSIDPNVARDLLKKLYQYLVPQEVRHNLGEYYTPDWLAELVINEVGYDGDTIKRVLDPACGSGTFLVLAIRRAKEHGAREKLIPAEVAKRIISNIWGFDLNPLAVIAARTNYLFALGELSNELQNLEIPVYLADSVLWPQQVTTQKELNFHGGDYVKVKTSIKEFHIPEDWIKDNGVLIRKAAPLIEQFVKSGFETTVALKHFKKKKLVNQLNEKIVEEFYEEILELEKQKKDRIWARFLKNAFAPMIAGRFDFVVGNPPWIRWDYLSNDYRKATLQLWKDYGLFSLEKRLFDALRLCFSRLLPKG